MYVHNIFLFPKNVLQIFWKNLQILNICIYIKYTYINIYEDICGIDALL